MICKECNTINANDALFCSNCGKKLTDAVEEIKEESSEAVETAEEKMTEAADKAEEKVEEVKEEIKEEAEKTEEMVEEVKTEVAPSAIAEPVIEKAEPVVEEVKKDVPPEVTVAASAFAAASASEVSEPAPFTAPASAEPAKSAQTSAPAPVKPSRQTVKENKKAEKQAKVREIIDAIPAEYKPISTSQYFWFGILSALPFIGLVMTLILSIAGKNKNRKNFFRAVLVVYIIALIISLVTTLVLVFTFPDRIEGVYDAFLDLIIDLQDLF